MADTISLASNFTRATVGASGFSHDASAAASPATNFKDMNPARPNRPRPHAFGVGKFGVGIYTPVDATRYLWTRSAAIVLGFALLILAPLTARAQNSYCESADALTPAYGFCKPSVDVEGSVYWGLKYNQNWVLAELAIQAQDLIIGQSTTTSASLIASLAAGGATTYVRINGGTMTGALNLTNVALTLTGPGGYATSSSSANFNAYFGDGSHLSGVLTGSGNNTATSSFTIVGALLVRGDSVTANAFFGDGSHLTGLTDSQISGLTADLAAKASSGTDNSLTRAKLLATIDPAATFLSSISILGGQGLLVQGTSVTASAFFGDGSHLSRLPSTGAVQGYFIKDTFTPDGTTKAFTLSLPPASAAALDVFVDGFKQNDSGPNIDYIWTNGTTITMTTAPASNSSSFYARYAVNTSTLPAVAMLSSTQTFSALNTFGKIVTLDFGAGGSPEVDFAQNGSAVGYLYYANANSVLKLNRTGNINGGISVDSSDRIGIGTTSPAEKLTIAAGEILLDNGFGMFTKDSGGTERETILAAGTTVFYGDTNTTQHRFASGRVGIGVAPIDGLLQMNSAAGIPNVIRMDVGGAAASYYGIAAVAGDIAGASSPGDMATRLFRGNFILSGSTATTLFIVRDSGSTDAPLQPQACTRYTGGGNIPSGVNSKVFWTTSDYNVQSLWNGASSSATFTVPVGAGGKYSFKAQMGLTPSALGTYREADIFVNGARTCTGYGIFNAIVALAPVECDIQLAAGDTFDMRVTDDHTAPALGSDGPTNFMCVRKY